MTAIYEFPAPNIGEDVNSLSKELLRAIIKLGRSPRDEVPKCVVETHVACSTLESIVLQCTDSYKNDTTKDVHKCMMEISVLVKQLITYAQYGQSLQEVLETISPQVKRLVVLSEKGFPKLVIK